MTRRLKDSASNERAWNRSFERLVAFHRTHGHFKIPPKGDSSGLYQWVTAQCLLKRHHRLRPERQQRLEELGLDWGRHQHNGDLRWERYLHQLIEFHQTHGHFEIPNKSPTAGLNQWAREQRQLQHSSQLTIDRRQRLEAVGFPWSAQQVTRNDQSWDRKFASLMEYRQTHGHFILKGQQAATNRLRKWVWLQRVHHRMHRLRPDRQQRLEAAGFTWNTPRQRERVALRWQAAREQLLNSPPAPLKT